MLPKLTSKSCCSCLSLLDYMLFLPQLGLEACFPKPGFGVYLSRSESLKVKSDLCYNIASSTRSGLDFAGSHSCAA